MASTTRHSHGVYGVIAIIGVIIAGIYIYKFNNKPAVVQPAEQVGAAQPVKSLPPEPAIQVKLSPQETSRQKSIINEFYAK
jgi:hypothetical protein